MQDSILFSGVPEKIRTPDLLIRSQTLYPAELLAHIGLFKPRDTFYHKISLLSILFCHLFFNYFLKFANYRLVFNIK